MSSMHRLRNMTAVSLRDDVLACARRNCKAACLAFVMGAPMHAGHAVGISSERPCVMCEHTFLVRTHRSLHTSYTLCLIGSFFKDNDCVCAALHAAPILSNSETKDEVFAHK